MDKLNTSTQFKSYQRTIEKWRKTSHLSSSSQITETPSRNIKLLFNNQEQLPSWMWHVSCLQQLARFSQTRQRTCGKPGRKRGSEGSWTDANISAWQHTSTLEERQRSGSSCRRDGWMMSKSLVYLRQRLQYVFLLKWELPDSNPQWKEGRGAPPLLHPPMGQFDLWSHLLT